MDHEINVDEGIIVSDEENIKNCDTFDVDIDGNYDLMGCIISICSIFKYGYYQYLEFIF